MKEGTPLGASVLGWLLSSVLDVQEGYGRRNHAIPADIQIRFGPI